MARLVSEAEGGYVAFMKPRSGGSSPEVVFASLMYFFSTQQANWLMGVSAAIFHVWRTIQ